MGIVGAPEIGRVVWVRTAGAPENARLVLAGTVEAPEIGRVAWAETAGAPDRVDAIVPSQDLIEAAK